MAYPPISPLPPVPSRLAPSTFPALSDAFLSAFPTMRTDFNALAAYLDTLALAASPGGVLGQLRPAVSGSVNGIALTTGSGLLAIVAGMQFRFRATGANTGATTINVDTRGPIACRTVTGVALPAGYIRADADTVATYDGTHWILSREIERGSNANGEYTRFADGSQKCTVSNTGSLAPNVANGQVFWSGPTPAAWTFPAAFIAAPVAFASALGTARWATVGTRTTSGTAFAIWAATTSGTLGGADLEATGYWY